MNILSLIGVFGLFVIAGCASNTAGTRRTPASDAGVPVSLPQGGRVGIHGMVLYGAGPYFVDHIPMVPSSVHDLQVIARVTLTDGFGMAIHADFSQQTFTIAPSSKFSLNDFVAGRLKGFSGTIFSGGFEEGGKPLDGFGTVRVEVQQIALARHLPAESDRGTFQVSDGKSNFQIGIITPDNNIQKIENATANKVLWCAKGPEFDSFCGQ